MHPTVLITDARRGSAIAFIRSLGDKGWRVIAADSSPKSSGFRSRFTSERLVYPPPRSAPRAFVETVLERVSAGSVDLVVPITDECVHPLARARERFAGLTQLAIAPDDALAIVTDKRATLALAQELGVPVPESRLVSSLDQGLCAAGELGFPVVLKPLVSRRYREDDDRIEKGTVRFARDRAELQRWLSAPELREGLLLQRCEPGVGIGIELLAQEGRVLRAFQHRRLAEIPLTGGASAWRESMALDPVLYRHARRLIESLAWTGLIMVEFRVGRAPWLMEINGRVWGSLPLACQAGVDFPGALAELYRPAGRARPAASPAYRVGARAYNLELLLSWIVQVLAGWGAPAGRPRPPRLRALCALACLLDPRQRSDLSGGRDFAPRVAEATAIVRKRARKLVQAAQRCWSARASLRGLAATRPVARTAALIERLDSSRPRILRVLTYHRLDGEAFRSQMAHISRRYRVVSIAQVLAALEGGPPLPARSVLLTFDDGYREFATIGWPILRAHGFAATLFVPTAYPDSCREGFWWDRLEQAFRRTARRRAIESPLGVLPMHTAAERERAHSLLKTHVKGLPHEQTLRTTDELCSLLGVDPLPHEVLGWDELRELAAQGVTLGAHTRTHPRLDRISRDEVRAEVLGSLQDLEREVRGVPRVFAYPDGRHDDEIVALLRSAGAELAFTTRRGTNDLSRCDALRLRRVNVRADDSAEVLRAKLVLSAARLQPAHRLLSPPSTAERLAERTHSSGLRRSKYVLRVLDAVLTARLTRPSVRRAEPPQARRRSSRSDRLRRFTRLALDLAPPLERTLTRALLAPERLPLWPARIELAGFGSGATVFRVESGAPGRRWALKIHRSSLGRDPGCLASAARRGQRRYERLRAAFGSVVLPGQFLVLHAPLCGARAVACVQPWLDGELHDLFGLDDAELRALLARHPALARSFGSFVRRALSCKASGWFPDLLGPGNLVAAQEPGGLRLRLIDYGIFELRGSAVSSRQQAAVTALSTWMQAFRTEEVNDVALGV